MIDLKPEIVRPGLGKFGVLRRIAGRAENDSVLVLRIVDIPLQTTALTLDSHQFLRGLGDYVLYDTPYQAALGSHVQLTQVVVSTAALFDVVEESRDLGNPPSAQRTGEKLKNVHRV